MTVHTHRTAPTQYVEANGIRFAYRRFGQNGGQNVDRTGSVPLVSEGQLQAVCVRGIIIYYRCVSSFPPPSVLFDFLVSLHRLSPKSPARHLFFLSLLLLQRSLAYSSSIPFRIFSSTESAPKSHRSFYSSHQHSSR